MAHSSFLDKFSSRRRRQARDPLAQVLRTVQDILNTKEGYGYFLRGFGLGGFPQKAATGKIVEALAKEIAGKIRQHEPRLQEVEVKPRGRDSALWLHFSVSAQLDGRLCRLRLLFDTITGEVRLESEEA
jgi:type VI secretion system protein